MSDSICGRACTAVPAGKMHPKSDKRGRTRYTVDGLTHPKGEPIRFKSKDRAERHIRNLGLEQG